MRWSSASRSSRREARPRASCIAASRPSHSCAVQREAERASRRSRSRSATPSSNARRSASRRATCCRRLARSASSFSTCSSCLPISSSFLCRASAPRRCSCSRASSASRSLRASTSRCRSSSARCSPRSSWCRRSRCCASAVAWPALSRPAASASTSASRPGGSRSTSSSWPPCPPTREAVSSRTICLLSLETARPVLRSTRSGAVQRPT
mmetsp:Transcript_77499/g.240900  ORF Transcript_77499/g.240900 Transcript_77499/m.240900 type:complete len:210 (+) Transcript_77499:836-1465(+)